MLNISSGPNPAITSRAGAGLGSPVRSSTGEEIDYLGCLFELSLDLTDMRGLEIPELEKILMQIVSEDTLRKKACALLGADAARVVDIIHKVPNFYISIGRRY